MGAEHVHVHVHIHVHVTSCIYMYVVYTDGLLFPYTFTQECVMRVHKADRVGC